MVCSFSPPTKNFFKKEKNQSFFDSFLERGSSLFKGFGVSGTKNYGMRKFMRNSLGEKTVGSVLKREQGSRQRNQFVYLLYVHELF
jgi:hypothetical protein